MKNIFIIMILLGTISVAHPARAQILPNPHTFSCADYIAAQQAQERREANAMAYWAVGAICRRGLLPCRRRASIPIHLRRTFETFMWR